MLPVMPTPTPVVSVCCITYNHEVLLAQAIESVLMQETNFAVEMVIGEDCSPDGTRAVAEDYARRYPNQVRVLAPTHNLGIMPNLIVTMAACTGEFIAFLEGDDYWTDPTKLQRQVDALRANPDCMLCFHDAEMVYETTPPKPSVVFSQHVASHALPAPVGDGPLQRFTQLDLAKAGWIIPSASMLFRRSSLPHPLPAWFAGVFSGDYTLHLLSTRTGPALYIPRIMSHYRIHDQSVTVTTAKSAYQYERRIYEGQMYQQHVFAPADKKHADIYLSIQLRNYARFLGGQGQRWQQLLQLAKYGYYYRQRLFLYIERRLDKLLQRR